MISILLNPIQEQGANFCFTEGFSLVILFFFSPAALNHSSGHITIFNKINKIKIIYFPASIKGTRSASSTWVPPSCCCSRPPNPVGWPSKPGRRSGLGSLLSRQPVDAMSRVTNKIKLSSKEKCEV